MYNDAMCKLYTLHKLHNVSVALTYVLTPFMGTKSVQSKAN
jgi:hypothetical protein